MTTVEVGKTYKIKCGWGWTRATLEGTILMDNGKTKYDWIAISGAPKGFCFCSYNLDNTVDA